MIQPPSNSAFLGVMTDVPGTGAAATPAKIEAFETMVGRKIKLCLNYRGFYEGNWPYTDTDRHEGWMAAGGRYPVITVGSGTPQPTIPNIAAGAEDAQIRALATRCKNFGHPLFLRPFWEMNGNWSPYNAARYGKNTPLFITAWRRFVDIFRNQGVTNVTWVWCPAHADLPREPWNHWTNYYPGDEYVDWVAADGYNRGTIPTDYEGTWRDMGDIFATFFEDFRGVKPFMIGETASVERGGSKADWILNAKSWMHQHPNCDALTWFHRAPNALEPEYDWRADSSASSLDAFKQLANDPYMRAGIGA